MFLKVLNFLVSLKMIPVSLDNASGLVHFKMLSVPSFISLLWNILLIIGVGNLGWLNTSTDVGGLMAKFKATAFLVNSGIYLLEIAFYLLLPFMTALALRRCPQLIFGLNLKMEKRCSITFLSYLMKTASAVLICTAYGHGSVVSGEQSEIRTSPLRAKSPPHLTTRK